MKVIFKYFLITIIVILIILVFGYYVLNLLWKKDFDKFSYISSKKETTEFLESNKKQLETIAKELYKKKTSKNKPYKNISDSRYHNDSEFIFSKKIQYIQFDVDAQGMLGGQYYGLIYIEDSSNNENLFIYDENKETGKGNNIFIREKITSNWYFYYDDYDGKVKIKDIKSDS